MDPLTKYLVYNKTPTTRHPMDYDTIKAQKKDVKEKGAAIDRRVRLLSPDIERVYEERVLYARNKLLNGAKPAVVGGKPISEELASDLRITCFSSASCPPRGEWIRTPLVMRPPDQPLGYGLAAPRNGARSLLSALQAHMIKWLLFDSRPPTKDNKCDVPPDT
ncbi:unnamed protein product [Arctia plantaginis]|uniref:Deubiquitinating enzyme MINDY-3/4 conserved domain-containing protein n=1 Tax=Arctia plantaginis TaxID=874455 RepID=A0A8S1B1A2_ARCPL|nr:unnamed protein product [Arctia plantaginis]